MELKVLKIKGKKSYCVIKAYDNLKNIYLNKKSLQDIPSGCIIQFTENDTIEYLSPTDILVEYRNGDKVMTVEEFQSKPTYYYDDTPDAEVLRRIANKKDVEGFKPVYKSSEFEEIELVIIGYVEDTKSAFITSSITMNSYDIGLHFMISGNDVSIDEFYNLKNEYGEHFKFEHENNKKYLRFSKINNSYVFGDYAPFCDRDYSKTFKTLEEAQNYENEVRDAVRKAVYRTVRREDKDKDITGYKAMQIVSRLQLMKKLSKNSILESIDVLIKDLEDFKLY